MNRYSLTFLIALPFTVSGAEILYVQSAKARLMEQPSFTAPVLTEIDKGDAVDVEQRSDRWIRVKHGSVSGWLPSLLLSAQKPVEKISVLDEESNVSGTARRRASAVITAGATRGLTADDRRRLDAQEVTNYAALRWIENIAVTEDDIDRFEREGRE